MSDSFMERDANFNPLCSWLGFPPNALPRDYYSLLGLPLFESDTREISRAAETLIAHVREIRPGPYVAEWTELIDTLRAAKACLCDPEQKRDYDQALRARRVHSLAPGSWLDAERVAVPADVFEQGHRGTETNTLGTRSRASGSMTVQDGFSPYAKTVSPGTLPRTGFARKKSKVTTRIFAIGLLLLAIIVAHQMLTAPEWWGPRLRGIMQLAFLQAENSQQRPMPSTSHSSDQSSARPSPVLPIAKSPQTSVSPFQQSGYSEPTWNPREVSAPISSHESLDSASEPAATGSDTSQPPQLPPQDQPLPSQNEVIPPADTSSSGTSQEVMPQPEEGETSHSNEMPPKTDPAHDEIPSADLLRSEFRTLIDEMWQAMAKRDLETARATLNRLAAEVKNDQERQAAESLDYLLRHLEEFWRTVYRVVPVMKSGEELAIGDTYIVVVEATRDEIVIRAAGQNRRYLIREMPTALIRVIVARRFRPGPEADALFGAFLAVDPKGDPREAEQLWRRADDEVLDADVLIAALKFRSGDSAP